MAKHKTSLVRKYEAQKSIRAYELQMRRIVEDAQGQKKEYIACDPKGRPRMFVDLVEAAKLGFGWKFYPV